MRGRGLTTIVGLGIVTALFLAIMSMFYLQQIPTKADLERLEDDIRRAHGIYLSAAHPITASLIRPEEGDDEGKRTGVRVLCTMRQDLRQHPRTVKLYLERIADGVIEHPDWRGRVAYVTVQHAVEPLLDVTRQIGEEDPEPVKAAAPPEKPKAPAEKPKAPEKAPAPAPAKKG